MSLTHYLYTFDGNGPRDITKYVQRYTHDLTRFGPYTARFSIDVEAASNAELSAFLDTWLMSRLDTISGGVVVWSGYIWEGRLDLFNVVRKRSMEDVKNRVKVYKRDPNNAGKYKYTDWFNNEDSQALYGIHEYLKMSNASGDIALDSYGAGIPNEDGDGWKYEADYAAQVLIDSYARPQAAYEVYTGSGDRSLDFTAIGRQGLANRIYVSDGNISDNPSTDTRDGTILRDSGLDDAPYNAYRHGDPLPISYEIYRLCAVGQNQSGWIYPQHIDMGNEVETSAGVSSAVGLLTRLGELADIPYHDGTPMQLSIENDGGVIYQKRERAKYFYYRNEGLLMPNRTPVGWLAKVAPIEVVDPVSAMMAGTRTIVPERVTVSGDGEARFGPLEQTDADIYDAILQNQKWLEDSKR